MKTIKLLLAVLSLATLPVQAQEDITTAFLKLMQVKDVDVRRNIDSEKIEGKMQKVSQVYAFTMPRNQFKLIQNVIDAFNGDSYGKNCYLLKQYLGQPEASTAPLGTYHIVIGSKAANLGRTVKNIKVGTDKSASYILACFIDVQNDRYRYCYAMEWRDIDGKGRKLKKITGRLIITYAEMLADNSDMFMEKDKFGQMAGNLVDAHQSLLMGFSYLKNEIKSCNQQQLEEKCLMMKLFVDNSADMITDEEREIWCQQLDEICSKLEEKFMGDADTAVSYLRLAQKALKKTN